MNYERLTPKTMIFQYQAIKLSLFAISFFHRLIVIVTCACLTRHSSNGIAQAFCLNELYFTGLTLKTTY